MSGRLHPSRWPIRNNAELQIAAEAWRKERPRSAMFASYLRVRARALELPDPTKPSGAPPPPSKANGLTYLQVRSRAPKSSLPPSLQGFNHWVPAKSTGIEAGSGLPEKLVVGRDPLGFDGVRIVKNKSLGEALRKSQRSGNWVSPKQEP